MTLDPLVDPRVVHHLDAVTAVLTPQQGAQVAAQVIEHLRGHIIEAVHAHAAAADPVAEVLAELDAPTDYKEADTISDSVEKTRIRSSGDIALFMAICGPLSGIAVGLVVAPYGNGASIGWLVHCAMQLMAIGIALSGLRQFRSRIAIGVAIGLVVVPMLLTLLGKPA